jgi:uracil-DNA glycosylase family 4
MDSVSKKYSRLETLAYQYSGCEKCALCTHRKRIIPGAGNADSNLFFVTDKFTETSRKEDAVITGPYKQLLETVLRTAGKDLSKMWVSSVVMCTHREGKSPKVPEVKACRDRLLEEIHIVQPEVIVAMGTNAVKALIPRNPPAVMTSAGMVYEAGVSGDLVPYKVPVMVTYSLSFLLKNPDNSPGGIWNRFFNHIRSALLIAGDLKSLERGNYDKPKGLYE